MENKKYSLFILSVFIAVLLGFNVCLSEMQEINGIKFSGRFPSQDMLDKAVEAVTVKKINDWPEENKGFRINKAVFRDGRILIEYVNEYTTSTLTPKYYLLFDLNGSFIEGFYSEDRIKNGVSNVFYSDGRLYIFHSFVNCLYFIDEDAIISCFYVPTEYELAMYRYDESIDGYNLVVNRTDTSGSVVLIDEKGHQTTVFSDLYDNSGNKKSEIVFLYGYHLLLQ